MEGVGTGIAVGFGLGMVGWAIVLALFMGFLISSERERPEWAVLLVLGLGFAAWYFWSVNIPLIIWHNLPIILAITAGYVILGTLWSLFKWDRFCARRRRDYEDNKIEYARQGRERGPDVSIFRPAVMQSKRKFFAWILLWPTSVFWYFLADLFKDLVDYIMRRMRGVYERITDRHFGDIAKPATAGTTEANLEGLLSEAKAKWRAS